MISLSAGLSCFSSLIGLGWSSGIGLSSCSVTASEPRSSKASKGYKYLEDSEMLVGMCY